jgi:hypothetical protein
MFHGRPHVQLGVGARIGISPTKPRTMSGVGANSASLRWLCRRTPGRRRLKSPVAMERAVGPVDRLGAITLGGAQGWDGFGPLDLGTGHRQIVLFHA